MDESLRRRLSRLGVVKGLAGLKADPDPGRAPRPESGTPSQVVLPGAEKAVADGVFWLDLRHYDRAYTHGHYALSGLADVPETALDLLGVPDLGDRPAFLDTETTGLAGGAGTLAFLVGVGVWTGEGFDLHLIFMRDPDEESAALTYLTEILSGVTGLVTFNGRGFDVPILETRYVLNRMSPAPLALPHLDLLTVARQLWRDHLPSRRLGELERHILDVMRTEQDLDSGLIPWMYRQYLATGDAREMVRVLYHNEIDVLSLASLLIHAARMVEMPAEMGLASAEWAGIGRVYDRAGCEDQAFRAWQVALSGETDELVASCAVRLWREMGVRYRRRKAWREALAIWDTWLNRLPGDVVPLVEKAKYYEWTVRDLDEALSCTEIGLARAAAHPKGMRRLGILAELEHRQERLKRKLARAEVRADTVRVVLATHNAGKRREWVELLAGLRVDVVLPEDIGISSDVEETGTTYTENAFLKARTLADASGLPALADDSGLEVDALDGAPGMHSARFRPGSDEVRYLALLKALEGVPAGVRGARFRCVAALVLPDGREFSTVGVCDGRIDTAAYGRGGFGYDPVFYVTEAGKTMAELTEAEKNRISHRARAAQAMRPILAAELDA